jgi:predicted nuclease of predicted toxin-antitoxin system
VKLLFDENLSFRLVSLVADEFPDSAHVRELGLSRSPDESIWRYAREEGFAIVTKDDDFRQMSFLFGPPPKVVWIRLGSCRTEEIAVFLQKMAGQVIEFGQDPEAALLVLG